MEVTHSSSSISWNSLIEEEELRDREERGDSQRRWQCGGGADPPRFAMIVDSTTVHILTLTAPHHSRSKCFAEYILMLII